MSIKTVSPSEVPWTKACCSKCNGSDEVYLDVGRVPASPKGLSPDDARLAEAGIQILNASIRWGCDGCGRNWEIHPDAAQEILALKAPPEEQRDGPLRLFDLALEWEVDKEAAERVDRSREVLGELSRRERRRLIAFDRGETLPLRLRLVGQLTSDPNAPPGNAYEGTDGPLFKRGTYATDWSEAMWVTSDQRTNVWGGPTKTASRWAARQLRALRAHLRAAGVQTPRFNRLALPMYQSREHKRSDAPDSSLTPSQSNTRPIWQHRGMSAPPFRALERLAYAGALGATGVIGLVVAIQYAAMIGIGGFLLYLGIKALIGAV
jgi:hypothetical protein